jgi:hypothetical protein
VAIAGDPTRPYPRCVSGYWQNVLLLAVTFGAVWHMAWNGT